MECYSHDGVGAMTMNCFCPLCFLRAVLFKTSELGGERLAKMRQAPGDDVSEGVPTLKSQRGDGYAWRTGVLISANVYGWAGDDYWIRIHRILRGQTNPITASRF